MEPAPSQTFLTCREALTSDQPHRGWSLIITVFGDLAQAPGERISGASLARIIDLAGLRPEAMRVALHRLRKDGWLESRRSGRSSVHFLTAFGRAQCVEANPRIYGPGATDDSPLHVLVADDSAAEARRALDAYVLAGRHVSLGTGVVVGTGAPPEDTAGLCVIAAADMVVPDWVRARVCPQDLANEYSRLLARFDAVLGELERAKSLPALEQAALRTLVVHSWRRVVLRHPDLPPRFFAADWHGPACRDRVHRILLQLPVADAAILEGGTAFEVSAAGPQRSVPAQAGGRPGTR